MAIGPGRPIHGHGANCQNRTAGLQEAFMHAYRRVHLRPDTGRRFCHFVIIAMDITRRNGRRELGDKHGPFKKSIELGGARYQIGLVTLVTR